MMTNSRSHHLDALKETAKPSIRFSRGTSGFGFVEVLIVMGVFSVAITAILYLNLHITRQGTQLSDLSGIDAFRRNFVTFIADDLSWAATLNANGGAMNCLRGGGGAGCAVYNRSSFNLYNASGGLVYNSTDTRNGVTLHGLPCGPDTPADATDPTFSARRASNYPSAGCPLRYTLQWAAMDNGPYPVVAIIATLTIGKNSAGTPYTNLIINPNQYAYALPSPQWPPPPDRWPATLIYRTAVP